jgi:hypothetical protein
MAKAGNRAAARTSSSWVAPWPVRKPISRTMMYRVILDHSGNGFREVAYLPCRLAGCRADRVDDRKA